MAFDIRQHLFANNASSHLASAINNSQTLISVATGEGALFPSPGVNQIFKLTIQDLATGNREIVHVTGRSGDNLTVERGQEDTDAQAFDAETLVQLRVTAETLHYLQWLLEETS